MISRRSIVALAVCCTGFLLTLRVADTLGQAAGQQAPIVTGNPAPSPEQIRALLARAIENQHRDDRAAEEFERTEHSIIRKVENGEITSDIVERILSSGTGNIKVKVSENGAPVPPENLRRDLEYAVTALNLAMHPNDRYREDLARYQKRRHDHDELVETSQKAFRATWAGRETLSDSNGPHTFAKFLLEPDPGYQPVNRFAVIFQHCRAVLWVDESQAQFARLEADIATDISFAGGIAGKVYRGGHVVMEQQEVAPGIWLPTLYIYNVDGRKFLSPFGIHERTQITNYRRIGSPSQAIEILRTELNNLRAASR